MGIAPATQREGYVDCRFESRVDELNVQLDTLEAGAANRGLHEDEARDLSHALRSVKMGFATVLQRLGTTYERGHERFLGTLSRAEAFAQGVEGEFRQEIMRHIGEARTDYAYVFGYLS